ncbi:MAG: PQQ-dependent sugar dehydrogenase, partial [Hymenobacteraceae bacterium]|nr:PQQ-dependent sugar dehydrogenase [Hymenobacteraceae bacterium]MDX5397487.1 PQQ-dependent sugar dehydrogenase [Hymenobacteraceae bacterium]MDX5513563.1 PQQ-dependent sugar dehydrogenase [Hymenobacteraceae bacterium]
MKKLLPFLLFSAFTFTTARAQITVGNTLVDTATVASNLNVPWELVWGPDNFIWMTERFGRISRVNPTNGQVTPLITITEVQTTSEGGLLGMALHPDFANNPYVYTVYTYSSGSTILEKVVRFTYNGSSLGSPFILLDNIIGANVHDGSRLLILPDNT